MLSITLNMERMVYILFVLSTGINQIQTQTRENGGLTSYQQLDRNVVDSVLKIVDDKFDSLSERISSLERSVNGLQYYNVRQFKVVNTNINSLDKILQGMNSQFGLMDVENKGLKVSFDLMKKDIKSMEKVNNLMFEAMENNFNYLNKGFSQKLEGLQNMVSVINQSSDEISQRLQDSLAKQPTNEINCSQVLEKFENKFDLVINNSLSSLQLLHEKPEEIQTAKDLKTLTFTLNDLNENVRRSMSYYHHTGDLVERIVGATETVAEDQVTIRDELHEFLEKQVNKTVCPKTQVIVKDPSSNPPSTDNQNQADYVATCKLPVNAITEFKQVLKNGSQLVELVTDLAQTSQISLKTTVVELLKEVHRMKETQKNTQNNQQPQTVNGFIEYDFELLLNATKGVLQMIEAVASNTRWIPYIFHNLQFVERQINHTLTSSNNIQVVLGQLGKTKNFTNSDNFTTAINYIYHTVTRLQRLTPSLTRLLGEPEPFIVLNGGDKDNEGRVEIYKKGKWGSLCGRFGHIEAAYICRHLGYMGGNSAGHGYFGGGSGMFWRINVSCLYSRQCDIVKPVIHTDHCDHKDDFAVICDHMVRLRTEEDSGNRNSGFLEIHHMEEWIRVCSSNWTVENTRVVCKQLGFEDGTLTSPPDDYVHPSNIRAVLNNVNCTGSEIRLDACNLGSWSPSHCTSNEFVHLKCS